MAKPTSLSAVPPAPFEVGDHVRGMSYVPPERDRWERPEPIEGDVVQVGAGWSGIDADRAYVWVRLPDRTERQALMQDVELCEPAETGAR